LYGPGCILRPHIDINDSVGKERGYNFRFGPDLVGVILKADSKGSLYFLDEHDKEVPLPEHDGAAFLLNGPTRDHFKHGVSSIADSRLSVTYRTVEFV